MANYRVLVLSSAFLVIMASFLVPHVYVVNSIEATTITLPTDNGSLIVEVTFESGNATNGSITIDTPQELNVQLSFVDPNSNLTIQHVNYDLVVVEEVGSAAKNILEKRSLHTHEGVDSHVIPLEESGSFLLTLSIVGTGINEPYDTKYSGGISLPITVTPEFSFPQLVAVSALAGSLIAATSKWRNRRI